MKPNSKAPSTDHVLAALSRELDRVVDVKEVSVDGDRMWILFDNADFVLRAVAAAPGTLEVQWTAAIRETPPNLGTWWTDWRSRHASTDDLVAEVLRARSWIRRMLDDQPQALGRYGRHRQCVSDSAATSTASRSR
jgi:hypothetical protein